MDGQENYTDSMPRLRKKEDEDGKDPNQRLRSSAVFTPGSYSHDFTSDSGRDSSGNSRMDFSPEGIKSMIYDKDEDRSADDRWVFDALYSVMCSPSDELNDLLYDVLVLRGDRFSSECLDTMEALDMVERRRELTPGRRRLGQRMKERGNISESGRLVAASLMGPATALIQAAESGSDIEIPMEDILIHMDDTELAESCFDLCISAIAASRSPEARNMLADRLIGLADSPRRILRLKMATISHMPERSDIGMLLDFKCSEPYSSMFGKLDSDLEHDRKLLFEWMGDYEEIRGACMVEIACIELCGMPSYDERRAGYISKIIENSRVFEDTAECYRISAGRL